MGIVFLILKCLGICDHEDQVTDIEEAPVSERDPLVQSGKTSPFNYGTSEEDDTESGMHNSSSEDLYDGKICVICYNKQRNCFFVPCGHCATCFECAKRYTQRYIYKKT